MKEQPQQQNILFYTNNNNISRAALKIINSNEILKNQFILIDMLDSSKKIPQKILDLKKSPVLILNGLNVRFVVVKF